MKYDLTYSEAIEQVMLHNKYFAPLKLIYKEIWKYKDKSKVSGFEVNPLKLDQIRPPIVYSEMLS